MSQIMVLTADRELLRVLKTALRDTPARIVFDTASPQAAADALARLPVGLVVVDLFLPGSSGLDAVKYLKRVNESCMMIMLTRMRTRNVIERAFRLGAQDVLYYPCGQEVLRETILHRLETQPMADSEEVGSGAQKAPPKK